MGVDYHLFWHLNPMRLRAFEEADRIKTEKQDYLNWLLGRYVMSALDASVCNSWLWRNKGDTPHKYINKPFLVQMEEKEEENTYKEAKEQIAVIEMKKRMKMLESQGLPESPM
jgi:hypothetical protein